MQRPEVFVAFLFPVLHFFFFSETRYSLTQVQDSEQDAKKNFLRSGEQEPGHFLGPCC